MVSKMVVFPSSSHVQEDLESPLDKDSLFDSNSQ